MSPRFDARAACRRLLDAESEADVQTLVASLPEMANDKNWRPLDGRETNFNVTSNQASDGGKALTELMTNMVDAVLMKHALQKGIDPKGRKAPATMHEAVDQLIKKLRGGKLTSLESKDPWLRHFAQSNLIIGVTGARSKRKGLPCYTFVDNGEGQHPDAFENSFLSLSTGNKKDIPFVQGRFNMGSSGVLGYCGSRWFKLIVSRRYDGTGPWGFTLMRKRPGGGMPVAEYFVLPNGNVPSFHEDALYPFIKGDGKRYQSVMISSGTVIKLYDYQIGSRFASGFRGSREALNENLVETILPFRILDFRQTPDPKRTGERAEGIDARPFYGMEFLLLNSQKEDDSSPDDADSDDEAAGTALIAVSNNTYPELGRITISAIRLRRALPGWLKSSNNRVFHAVNGQVQFKQTRGYLSQSCGFPALKDRIIVIVDSSDLSYEAHNEIWKGDREHIRNTIVGERYQQVVTAAIKESKALHDLQQEVAREELQQAAKSERNELFQKLVKADRNLAGLLTNRDPTISVPMVNGGRGGGNAGDASESKFEGKYNPTYLQFDEKQKDRPVSLPLNRTRSVSARTDVENGYLQRADNKGDVLFDPSLDDRFGVRMQLYNGRLTLYLDPIPGSLAVGDQVDVRISLQDPCMARPIYDELSIVMVEEEKEVKKPKAKVEPVVDGKGRGGTQGKLSATHGLPKYRLLTNDGRPVGGQETLAWPEGFTEYDGGFVEDYGDNGLVYKINYDNSYHLKYRMTARGDIARDVVTEKYVLGMRILMLGYEHALRTLKELKKDFSHDLAELQDDFRRMAARGAAATVLALAENLPKIIDKASITAAQDVE